MTPGEYIFYEGLSDFQPRGHRPPNFVGRWLRRHTPVLVAGIVVIFVAKMGLDSFTQYLAHLSLTN